MLGESKLVRLKYVTAILIILIYLLTGSSRASALQYFEVDGTGVYGVTQCTGYQCGLSGGTTESGNISAVFAFDPSLYASYPNGYTATLGGSPVTDPWLSLVSASINGQNITGALTSTLAPPPGSYVTSFNIQQAQTQSTSGVKYAVMQNYQSGLYNDPSSPLGGFQFGDQTVQYSADTVKDLRISTSTLNIDAGSIVAGLPFSAINSANGDLFLANTSASVNQQEVYGLQGTILSSKLLTAPDLPSPTSQACTAAISNSVRAFTGSTLSGTNQPVDINAIFAPAGGSISAAAAACGVTTFDWIQKVTALPDPSPFSAFDPTNPNVPIPLGSASAPFNDPYQNGYTYQLYCSRDRTSPLPGDPASAIAHEMDSNPSVSYRGSYPFYYSVNGLPSDCGSLAYHMSSSPSYLSFFDSPDDRLLPTGSSLAFATCLVGVDKNNNPVILPSSDSPCFNWTDNFTGLNMACDSQTPSSTSRDCTIFSGLNTGGASQFVSELSSGYPGLGAGGITIVEAPEPASLTLFAGSIGVILLLRRRRLSVVQGWAGLQTD